MATFPDIDIKARRNVQSSPEPWLAFCAELEGFDARMPAVVVRGNCRGAEALIGTDASCANALGTLHGGFLAAAAEQLLSSPLFVRDGVDGSRVVTVGYSLQYLRPGRVGVPLHGYVELQHETGRLAFVQGVLTQEGESCVSFTATLRKLRG